MPFTTTSLKDAFPYLEDRYGQNKRVAIDATIGNATARLGQFDADMVIDHILHLSIEVEGQKVFEDDLDAVISADLTMDNDVFYFKLMDWKLRTLPADKTSARFDRMGLTAQEYRAMRDALHFSLSDLRTKVNEEYFNHGVYLPYNSQEIRTSLAFRPENMYILMEIEEGVERYFEDHLWSDDDDETWVTFGE